MAIDYFSIHHPFRRTASRISYRVRNDIFGSFMKVMHPTSDASILDIGVTPDEELPESNFFETLYPYKNRIVAASIEDASFLEKKYPGLTFVQTAKNGLPFNDHSFDVAFCSAVLEHVGDRHQQRLFIRELLRVARSFFITTPNRCFPMEIHTFLPLIHWLPQPVHQKLLKQLGLHFWASTQNLNLLTPSSLKALFPSEVHVHVSHVFLLGAPSNLIAYGDSMLRDKS